MSPTEEERERRRFLELELAAVQRLYDGEKARRETVRASLAIPFATVSLIMLSMGILSRVFPDAIQAPGNGLLQVLIVAPAVIAVVLLLFSLVLIFAVDYAAIDADGLYLDLSRQRERIEKTLARSQEDPHIRQARAEFSAISGAIAGYDRALDDLRRSNEHNLLRQSQCLRLLLLCVGFVVLSLSLALATGTLTGTTDGARAMETAGSAPSPLRSEAKKSTMNGAYQRGPNVFPEGTRRGS